MQSNPSQPEETHTNIMNCKTVLLDGLWQDNPGLVKLLGLCPLLAVSNTLVNAFGLGLATLITLLVSSSLVSLLRSHIINSIRIPLYVIIIATTVTLIELAMQAWLPDLFLSLGIFLPLIVTNCLILGRAESLAARQPFTVAVLDAFSMGVGFLLVLLVLGGARELLAQGSLLADSTHLFGSMASDWPVHIFDQKHGFLLAALPPGAFIGLGMMLALKNSIDQKRLLSSKKRQRKTILAQLDS